MPQHRFPRPFIRPKAAWRSPAFQLDFIRRCLEKFGTAGQPLWPVVASSLYGAFLDGRLAGVRVLVITYDASVFGWGAVLRATHEDSGHVIVGGFRMALDLLGEAHLEPSTAADDPAAQAAAARVRASVVALQGLEHRQRITAPARTELSV